MRPPETIAIEELIPQRRPLVMIDRLLEADGERGMASKTFGAGEYAVSGDQVCETALVECVAQATAALLGYQRPSPSEAPGFLVGLSSFFVVRRPKIGELLLIEVRPGRVFGELFMVYGRVFAGKISGECIAKGELKIYRKNEKD